MMEYSIDIMLRNDDIAGNSERIDIMKQKVMDDIKNNKINNVYDINIERMKRRGNKMGV